MANAREKQIGEHISRLYELVQKEFPDRYDMHDLLSALDKVHETFQRIIALRYYDQAEQSFRQPPSRSTIAAIYRRDGFQCRYCGGVQGPWHLDHVCPVAQGGLSDPANLVVACEACNCRKGPRNPEQAGMVLLDAPENPIRERIPAVK